MLRVGIGQPAEESQCHPQLRTYHLYFTTVDGLAAPFSSGITDKLQVPMGLSHAVGLDEPQCRVSQTFRCELAVLLLQAILHALGHEPPLPLSEARDSFSGALVWEECKKGCSSFVQYRRTRCRRMRWTSA